MTPRTIIPPVSAPDDRAEFLAALDELKEAAQAFHGRGVATAIVRAIGAWDRREVRLQRELREAREGRTNG